MLNNCQKYIENITNDVIEIFMLYIEDMLKI